MNFMTITDHKSLKHLFTQKNLNKGDGWEECEVFTDYKSLKHLFTQKNLNIGDGWRHSAITNVRLSIT